ncbi:pimeloyl-ACP methyl ester carboxylesterase [Streptomyces sp. BK022]|uniref:alpha/beta fold hydrolase n=1 Tax=Streptomyces sp. BK022 TaxID=2512123 RepID=UPI001029D810|nr:alpha/beta hydrolase [Streptomyces sp. BK022]RZU37449.1 pimeloyl-ACP methyl ester carboxylesterase [Streptomyces sp. BK022]
MVTRRFAGVGGVRLAYRVWGPPEGPPLVLLPALGEVSGDWDTVAAELAHGRRVYAVDLRGHGDSGRPGTSSLELMRADVLGLLDVLGLDRIDLVGHSLGGIVAYLVAAARPGLVDRLVLEDVGAPCPRPATAPERPDGELPFDWAMVLAVRRQIDSPPGDWLTALGDITAETLVLAGGPRSHIPQESVSRLARLIPDARLRTIPVGHLIHREAPEAFAEAVMEFLGGPSAG